MMILSMSDTKLLKITGDVDGEWVVDAELPDGRLVIRPVAYPAVLSAGTGRALTEQELDGSFRCMRVDSPRTAGVWPFWPGAFLSTCRG